MPAEPAIECYETATFNDAICGWNITGTMPVEPVVECYETNTFNAASCQWETIGEIPTCNDPICNDEGITSYTLNTTTCECDETV
jgi:hypothetical protein